jgi:hypothetical protein
VDVVRKQGDAVPLHCNAPQTHVGRWIMVGLSIRTIFVFCTAAVCHQVRRSGIFLMLPQKKMPGRRNLENF